MVRVLGTYVTAVFLLSVWAGDGALLAAQKEAASSISTDRLKRLEDAQRRLDSELQLLRDQIAQLTEKLNARQGTRVTAPRLPSQPLIIEGLPSKGSDRARLVIIEFADFQCPFCRRHSTEILPLIERDFIATGKVRYVFWNFPLDIHPQAEMAAKAAECAHRQGRFWDMHARLFAAEGPVLSASFDSDAVGAGVSVLAFRTCMESDNVSTFVRGQAKEARQLEITGTPTFLLGLLDADGKARILRRFTGAQPYSVFRDQLDQLGSEVATSAGGSLR